MKLLNNWGATARGSGIVLTPPSNRALRYFLDEGFPVDLTGYDHVWVKDRGGLTDITCLLDHSPPLTFNAPINQEINMPLAIAQMEASPTLLRVMMELAEKECPTGVVDLATGYQKAVSENSISTDSGLFFSGISASDALSIKRSDLWLPEDLTAFSLEWPKILTANDSDSVMEWTWRGRMPGGNQLKKFITRYRLIDDGGRLFHACEAVAWEDLEPPAQLTAEEEEQ